MTPNATLSSPAMLLILLLIDHSPPCRALALSHPQTLISHLVLNFLSHFTLSAVFSFLKSINQKVNFSEDKMNRGILDLVRGLSAAFIIIVIGSYVIVAQSAITGEWSAKVKDKAADKIHISFERRGSRGGKNQNGSTYSFDELRGLSFGQTQNGRVSFSLVRDAGTIECEGAFTNGKGSGTFRFTPSRAFIDAMRSRGFDFTKGSPDSEETAERLFAAATLNVTIALADDLRSANFDNLETDDLFKAAIFKINGQFMSEMKATGFPNLSMEDLVKARIFKIDAKFVQGIRDIGFGADDFENLVKYSIFKVTPDYLNSLRAEGLTDLSPEQVVKLRIFKVDAAFVRQARAEDPNITVDKIVEKKIGVWVR